ncbi:hypothetical protein N0V90_010512 [Kalmusia sp. IMI 367209]|nr:hypothetical protein N0V90_010512 [Kalmusia sp. IMI 367209]
MFRAPGEQKHQKKKQAASKYALLRDTLNAYLLLKLTPATDSARATTIYRIADKRLLKSLAEQGRKSLYNEKDKVPGRALNATPIKEFFKDGVQNYPPRGRKQGAEEAARAGDIGKEEESLKNCEHAKEAVRSGEIHSGIAGEMVRFAKIGMVKIGEGWLRQDGVGSRE